MDRETPSGFVASKESLFSGGIWGWAVLQRRLEQQLQASQRRGKTIKGNHSRTLVADQHVHLCVNQIVELALKHQSQIIMGDLSALPTSQKQGKGQRNYAFQTVIPRLQFQKLQNVLKRFC